MYGGPSPFQKKPPIKRSSTEDITIPTLKKESSMKK